MIWHTNFLFRNFEKHPSCHLRLQLAALLELQFTPPRAMDGGDGAYEGIGEWLDNEAVQQWLQTAGLRVTQWAAKNGCLMWLLERQHVSTQLEKLIHLQCPFFWGWDVGWTHPETAQPFSKFSRWCLNQFQAVLALYLTNERISLVDTAGILLTNGVIQLLKPCLEEAGGENIIDICWGAHPVTVDSLDFFKPPLGTATERGASQNIWYM